MDIQLVNGYNRKETLVFRTPETIAELIGYCNVNSHIWFKAIDGTARQCKVNGRVRTWKRDPNRVEIPVKYGMYEYSTFYANDMERILIPL